MQQKNIFFFATNDLVNSENSRLLNFSTTGAGHKSAKNRTFHQVSFYYAPCHLLKNGLDEENSTWGKLGAMRFVKSQAASAELV